MFTGCRNANGKELNREKHTVLPEREERGGDSYPLKMEPGRGEGNIPGKEA